MTAIANDFGYEEVFARQLEVLAAPGDVVVAISTSGNSRSVFEAGVSGKEREYSMRQLMQEAMASTLQ